MLCPNPGTVTATACGWCGDESPDHSHFAIVVCEASGKLLGRLCPDGTIANRKIHAAVLSRITAEKVAGEINDKGLFTARVVRF